MNKTITWVIVALVVLLGGWYLLKGNSNYQNTQGSSNNPYNTGTQSGTESAGNTSSQGLPPINPSDVPGTTGTTGTTVVKTFTISGQSFSFSPSAISVNKGDTVHITFKDVGGSHDLRIDGYNVGTPVINGGQEASFTFVADKAGTFEYYCSVGTHRQMGMRGTLTVK